LELNQARATRSSADAQIFLQESCLDFTKGWITEAVTGSLPPGDNEDEDMLGVLLGERG